MFSYVSVALLLSLSSSIGMPAVAAPLQSSEKWDVDYGITQCTAARAFDGGSGQVVVGIVPAFSGDSYKLLVSIERRGPLIARQSAGTVDFGAGPINAPALYYGGKGVHMSVYQFRLAATELEKARSASTISLSAGDGSHYAFALSDMPAVLDGLRQCTGDLQRYWNMSGTTKLSGPELTGGDIRSLITPADYAAASSTHSQPGPTQYQLLIDESGSVAGCDVFASSGDPALDSIGCEVIHKRARFRPAQDSRGNPIRSVFTTAPISWRPADLTYFDCQVIQESYRRQHVSLCGESQPAPMYVPRRVNPSTTGKPLGETTHQLTQISHVAWNH